MTIQNQKNRKVKNMKDNEKQLFKNLCSFKNETFEDSLLEFATPSVLGQLFYNRMQAVAYGVIQNHKLLTKINREFRNSIKCAWEQNKEKNDSFLKCVSYLSAILTDCDCKYAMLKGALLCGLYPEGYRTSNDIDLLVLPNDVTKISNVLHNAGFLQGNIRNGEFVPASRKEIIESKITRGETVPFIKEVNLPQMKYLEVDINFSLDYKSSDADILQEFIDNICEKEVDGIKISTLGFTDFFIHLCCHLYKEATTLPWIEMNRDMTLYKYCDIYLLLSQMYDKELLQVFSRAEKLGLEKICSFAVLHTAQLFELKNPNAITIAKAFLSSDPNFIHRIVSPKDSKVYEYTEKNIFERLFSSMRKELLQEVNTNEQT